MESLLGKLGRDSKCVLTDAPSNVAVEDVVEGSAVLLFLDYYTMSLRMGHSHVCQVLASGLFRWLFTSSSFDEVLQLVTCDVVEVLDAAKEITESNKVELLLVVSIKLWPQVILSLVAMVTGAFIMVHELKLMLYSEIVNLLEASR